MFAFSFLMAALLAIGTEQLTERVSPEMRAVLDWNVFEACLTSYADMERRCDLLLKLGGMLDGRVKGALLLRRGAARFYGERYAEGESDVDQAILLCPDDADGLCFKAFICRRDTKRKLESLAIAERLMRDRPDYARAYIVAGAYYDDIRSFFAAESYYNKALERAPLSFMARFGRAIVYSHEHKAKRCLDDVAMCLLTPGTPDKLRLSDLYFLRGMSLIDLMRVEEAVPCLEMARQLEPGSRDCLIELWIGYGLLGRSGLCYEISRDAMKRYPKDAFITELHARSLEPIPKPLQHYK